MTEATSFFIDSDEMYRLAGLLQQLENQMASICEQLVIVDHIVSHPELVLAGAPAAAYTAKLDIWQGQICAIEAELPARLAAMALMSAADVYGLVEGGLKGAVDLLGQNVIGVKVPISLG